MKIRLTTNNVSAIISLSVKNLKNKISKARRENDFRLANKNNS